MSSSISNNEVSKTVEPSNKDSFANPLSKKLNKILETRLDNDKEVLDALKSLSVFFTDNNIRTRRSLRSDIEKRSVAIHEQFIQAFSQVTEKLDGVHKEVEAMNACCRDMTTRLKETKCQTHDLIGQTTKLQMEGQRLQLRSQMVEIFLKKFQLSGDEVMALKGSKDGHLHEDFFTSLARVKQIHNDCKILLRTNHQTAGLEIMESMALQQESAYERLYRWTQNECCLLTNDNAEVTSKLCQAVLALKDRPVLFKYSLDEYSTARRTAVVRSFIDAMTRGGVMAGVVGGAKHARPIELHSHDPLRYLGDMLAWVHQATASEREGVVCLLKMVVVDDMESTILGMLQHIIEGVCRPLKMRIEQVLTSEQTVTTLYKLSNLIHFYKNTIGQMLPVQNSGVIFLLEECVSLSFELFFSALSLTASHLMDTVEAPPPDLSPTPSLTLTLQLLKDLLSSDHSSVALEDDRKNVFAQILCTIIDPLIQMCVLSASSLDTVSMAVYMLNNLYVIQCTVALFEYTDQRIEMLQAQMDAQIDSLVGEQASYILSNCSINNICSTLQASNNSQTPLSTLPGMDAASIKAAMSLFDKHLSSTDALVLPQCSQVHSSKYRELVRRRTAELIGMAYKQLYEALELPSNLYPPVQTLAPLSPPQVLKLLN